MAENHWAQRLRATSAAPHELLEVGTVVHDLAQEANHAPGQSGPVFQNVTQVLLLGTALVSSTLAVLHLYKALSRPHAAPRSGHRPGHDKADERRPPQRHQDGDPGRRGRG